MTDRVQKDVSETDVKGKMNEQNPLALDTPWLSNKQYTLSGNYQKSYALFKKLKNSGLSVSQDFPEFYCLTSVKDRIITHCDILWNIKDEILTKK